MSHTPLRQAIESLKDNKEQWRAFNATSHCVVLAPPGSGKTHLLSTRVGSDMLGAELPRGAACITLTNPAAHELQERLRRIEVTPFSTLFVGTMHSFALSQLIKPFARLTKYESVSQCRIATAKQLETSYRRAIQGLHLNLNPKRTQQDIEYHRKRMTPASEWRNLPGDLMAVARRQRELMRSVGLTDFDELVAVAVRLVKEHKNVREAMRARFPRIYVDEYQDLAPGLDALVRELCFSSGDSTLFAVGDPDQAIFGFTGSKAELLDDLALIPTIEAVPLARNYRCGNEIIRAADRLRPTASSRPTYGNPGGRVVVRRVEGSIRDQAHAALEYLRTVIARTNRLPEAAILCPTNRNCQEVAAVLEPSQLSYFVRSEAYRPTASTLLLESMAGWISYGRETGDNRLVGLFDRWRALMGSHATLTRRIRLAEILLSADGNKFASGLIEEVAANGLHDALTAGHAEDLEEFENMRRSAAVGELRRTSIAKFGQRSVKRDRVEITTMTSCKGLEFDLIFILGADQERIPHFRSLQDSSRLAEDRRKFYVAVTRARHEVVIYYSGYVWSPEEPNKETGPSQFLREMNLLS